MELQSTGFSKLFIQCFFMQVMFFKMYLNACFCFSLLKTPFSHSSLPVPAGLEQIQNVKVEEGRNVKKECNVTSGTPPLNVFCKDVKTGQVIKGKLLTIINIRRNQSGEYRCIVNNTCGKESTGMFIDVHCKKLYFFTRPSNVCYSMLVSVLHNCVFSHIAVISMLLLPSHRITM